MTVIIAIFDDSNALDKAIITLNENGFKERVFDQGIMSREVGIGMAPVHMPTAGPIPGSTGIAGSVPQTDSAAIIGAFKDHLSRLHLSDEQIEAYVTHFVHEGKFVIVMVDAKRASEVVDILRTANASQVNRHG